MGLSADSTKPRQRRPTTPIVPSRIRTILLQSNDRTLPGQYVTKATDLHGAVLQCLRSVGVPPKDTVLSLMCPDPAYGRVRFIARAIKEVPFALGGMGSLGGEHFAVQWVAIASLRRRSHLVNALQAIAGLTLEGLEGIPEVLPERHELIYTASTKTVDLVPLEAGQNRVMTERLSAAEPPPGWPSP